MIVNSIIRIRVDVSRRDGLTDAITGQSPSMWVGNDARVELGLFSGDEVLDIGSISSLLVIVKDTRTGSVLWSVTVPAGNLSSALTAATWADRTAQHVAVDFTNAQTNQTIVGTESELWMVVAAITSDVPAKRFTLGAGVFKLLQDGYDEGGVPPDPTTSYYSAAEADARFLPQQYTGSTWRWHLGAWYVYIASTALWYPLTAADAGGIPTLALGEGVSL